MRLAVNRGFSGSVLLLKNDKILLDKGYGFADGTTPYTSTTIYDMGSFGKQFTATALMLLQEKKKLKITDSIGKYFSNVPGDKAAITIHHLLTHTSGLPHMLPWDSISEKMKRDEAAERIMETPLIGPVEQQFSYSNTAYVLAAIIIEKVSGMSYEKFLNENLFKPAGMQLTGYIIPKYDRAKIASGFLEDTITMIKPIDIAWIEDGLTWLLRGAGGLLTTNEDRYKWHKALQSGKIVSRQSVDIIQSMQVKPGMIKDSPNAGYGYGWFIRPTSRNTRVIEHGGNIGSLNSDFRYYPEENILLIMSGNSNKITARQLVQPIEKILFKSS